MDDTYILDNCQIYNDFFTIEEKTIAIPELWKTINWNDPLFEKYIKEYVIDPIDYSKYASENLQLISNAFFKN